MKSYSTLLGAAALLALQVMPTQGFVGPLKPATSTTKLSVSFFGNGSSKKGSASKGVLVVGYVHYLSRPLPSLPFSNPCLPSFLSTVPQGKRESVW